MLDTDSVSRSKPRQKRTRRRPLHAKTLVAATPALLALLLSSSYIAVSASSSSLTPATSEPHDAKLPILGNALPADQGTNTEHSIDHTSRGTATDAPESLNRRKHVTFQDVDQQQGSSATDRVLVGSSDDSTSPSMLQYENLPLAELDVALDAESGAASLPQSGSYPLQQSDPRRYDTQRSAGRSNVYNQDLVGKQTGNGYVFVRHTDPNLSITGAGAALVTLFSRRDSPVSRPPLVPNSNSRLLIGLVIVCIIAVGVLTLAAQEMYRRMQTLGQPRSPLRRRSGEGRSSRPFYRSDSSYTSLTSNGLAAPSLEEEEERIKTPPTLSRRSSAAASSLAPSPHNENGPDSDDEEYERKTSNDLHYFSLPFGIGIGYSYANIADNRDARTRITRLAAKRSRRHSGSTLALSTGALPVPSTGAVNGTDGLRSRSRSFKELCRDAFGSTASRDIGIISEEEGDSDMTTVSTPRWGSSLVSLDLSGSERGSGTVTPTGPSAAGGGTFLSSSTSSIALEDLASSHGSSAKGRYFGVENGSAAPSGHTLIDLGLGTPELAVSDPDGITRPASTPGVMPSQVARHPQVEQLRREGRSETGKRVGKGTPTNAKLF
ncbi:uncharacterized protein UTRI_10593_B [Ustilago trichophora]|uniref:Uncharacterized protein n=1 Tax=Ustilago trichophora TaxID=86804 RepID=A0A5C3E969_9BASI|nr:uncharacterized protein UTRI_10593_B [Ustilago trichophora]